jgi:PAS domain S-box-containing protein
LYGYAAHEAIGQSIFMLVPVDCVQEARRINERLRQGEGVEHLETRRRRKDGREVIVTLTLSPVKDAASSVVGASVIARDVTERKHLEDQLRLQGLIAANMGEGICLVRERDAAIAYANERFADMFRYDPAELVGQPVAVLNAPTDKSPQETATDIIRVLRETGIWRGEVQNVRKDGTRFWTYASVSTFEHPEYGTVWVSLQSDITERKRMEAALRDSEAKLRAVVETAVDAIITIDEQGLIDSVNPAAERMFGYTVGEMIGRNVKMLMPSPYREEHDGYLARYLQTGEKRIINIGREVQARRKDGFTFPVDLAVSEFQDQNQRLFTGMLRDISSRKQLEREVLEIATMEQRRIGQQLHDSTGQELTALGLLAQTLAETLEGQSTVEATLAAKVVQGLQRVLSQVRSFSRGLIPVEIDSRGLHAALTELASRTSELHGVTCTFEGEEHVPVEDNHTATHLYHVAQEAVTNALRHGRPSHITISLEGDARSLMLRVHDDGIGFPEEPVNSKGMGLKIMRYRAGLVNARLTVERAEPTGTLVTCTLNKGATHDQGQDEQE